MTGATQLHSHQRGNLESFGRKWGGTNTHKEWWQWGFEPGTMRQTLHHRSARMLIYLTAETDFSHTCSLSLNPANLNQDRQNLEPVFTDAVKLPDVGMAVCLHVYQSCSSSIHSLAAGEMACWRARIHHASFSKTKQGVGGMCMRSKEILWAGISLCDEVSLPPG